MEYLRGLLITPGRKSIRNIAAVGGGTATEQSLHHFVSDSTWDWAPVRRALTAFVAGWSQPQALVLRPMVIPKAGNQSVGVSRRFDPVLGQTLNAQQAVGVWVASESVSSPVNWRLHLSQAWLTDRGRRGRAAIPDEVGPETIGDCAVAAYLETAEWLELPLVLDARELGSLATVERLLAAGAPFLARIDSTLRLGAAGTVLPGHGADTVPAQWLMGAAKDLRRPVTWTAHGLLRTGLAATVRVTLPGAADDLFLLGAAAGGESWPTELWLTNVTAQAAVLLRLSTLVRRVDRDFTEIADQVGIRDFSGRSFDGWHRHVTLASAAHAVVAMAAQSGRLSDVS
jgi:syndecan 1